LPPYVVWYDTKSEPHHLFLPHLALGRLASCYPSFFGTREQQLEYRHKS
jgi:hypothetical protein